MLKAYKVFLYGFLNFRPCFYLYNLFRYMNATPQKPIEVLNIAFRKVKPSRAEIDTFKQNLLQLLDHANPKESEEYHKNLVADFLKNTYYSPAHFINTHGRKDLVVHNAEKPSSSVGLILEAKSPANKTEMLTPQKLNAKALQELVLYYLRERIKNLNLEVKHLIVTNLYEWFVFDATTFDRLFAQNKKLVQQFNEFEGGRLAETKTDFFYKQIAEPFLAQLSENLPYTYFNLREYEPLLRQTHSNPEAETPLIYLYKILSPEHLLKKPFANDSNSLDKRFYAELLHIIGLTETKEGGKKLIERNPKGSRHAASLLEETIIQLDGSDKISRLKNAAQFGNTTEERYFSVALELVITWVNRILFLKLLEAQLVAYHKGDKSYTFLNAGKIREYDELNALFFQVLAKQPQARIEDVQEMFGKVPYLNSSLFELTELEHETFVISSLRDNRPLALYAQTVLKDEQGKRLTGQMNTLEYLFAFLDAYDFSSEGSEQIQEEAKTIINASVLGLIFEKINGYKDGSFFTPGFITMYMCRETIRKAVLQKFNEDSQYAQQPAASIDELYNRITDRKQANDIINSLKICDPAVGSGHFLVSALNEIIAIKYELGILQDRHGKRLKDYHVKVENDELVVTDEDAKLFQYNPRNPESQRVQETLFHEKQTIIENCLFGVDINPNSVKICRLRLWIELLKNAYYKTDTALETLPNIDINIKCGNSLVSRFATDADLGQALKQSKWNIETYKNAVDTYRNAQSKEEKREMEGLIADIKGDFRTEIGKKDPKLAKKRKLEGELFNLMNQVSVFGETEKEKKERNKKAEKYAQEIQQIETEIEDIKNNKIYENAFEWRFEFPEVLNDDGDFVGFDAVIGNPPYIRQEEFTELKPYLKARFETFAGTADIYIFFVEHAFNILKQSGSFAYILPNKWLRASYGAALRQWTQKQQIISIIDFGDLPVFDEATTYPCVWFMQKKLADSDYFKAIEIKSLDNLDLADFVQKNAFDINKTLLQASGWTLVDDTLQKLIDKIKKAGVPLAEYVDGKIFRGIVTGFNEAFVVDAALKEELVAQDPASAEILKPFLAGRDIKRYQQPISDKYLIFAKRGIEIEKYPAILAHLQKFKPQLEKKAGGVKWYELQASPSDYEKFEMIKIMYPDISKELNFIIDYHSHYSVNTVYNIASSSNELLGFLNSKVFHFYFKQVSNSIRGGYLRFFTDYVQNCPVAKGLDVLNPLVTKILSQKQADPAADTSALEKEIDVLVYGLYGLTAEEIAIVEQTL